MAKAKAPRRKHVPMRTCIICRATSGKRELVRIVRTPEGAVHVDPGGKAAGRGAYICRSRTCWEQALQGRLAPRLSAALKSPVSAEDLAGLAAFVETLPETLASEA